MDRLVSIIIPAYQQEKKISRCLESVLASSYSACEIIVVNDGSTDRTGEIVRQFINKTCLGEAAIKLINISHGGPARARNVGMLHAKGQFIGFLDADDMLASQMIERLAESLLRGNDLAACGLQICDENGKPAHWQYPLREQHRQCPGDALELVMWEQILMSVSPALFWREKILNKQGKLLVKFHEELVEFEDFVFVCEYISKCEGFMEVIPFYGAFYCKCSGSLTTEILTVYELRQAMKMILEIGEGVIGSELIAHKLQHSFRFMAFWYKEALRCKKRDFMPNCKSWKICMEELERYADVFMTEKNVSYYKKIAIQIVRKYPELGRLLAKTIGRVMLRTK